jgi:hypothetical protein
MALQKELPVNGQGTIASASGDDTIELQLTPQQLRELSRAAEAAEAAQTTEPVAPARKSTYMNIAKMAAAIVAYGVFAWWSASHLVAQPQPQATAAAKPPVVIPQPVSIVSAPEPVVRVNNPFDATEVFEFPPGTSQAESRDKVAQILLQRARDRQARLGHLRPAPSVRTASLYGSP